MGGKKKQATRTKGNTRPSSSGRSAEKLAASGNSLTGFVGFSSLQGDPTFIPATQGNEELDATVDAEFRLVLRKMSKRDSVTKLKAIQEFVVLCRERDVAAVKSILPFWPRVFNRLSMDFERRIREATFQALDAIVMTVQKSIAPQLRSIMGCWLMGQCDCYAPAASAAKCAFQSAFSESKQVEALLYCKADILALIEENLFHQTAESLNETDALPPEEMEDKYIRTITSSLYAWKLFFTLIPSNEHERLKETYKKILDNDNFWKFHKHKSPMIRGAWFSLLTAILEHISSLVQNNVVKMMSIIFNNLDESNFNVSPFIWECAMKAIFVIEDCWLHINVRKTLIPKLHSVLRKGGNGSATIIYSSVLSLVKSIPQEHITGENNFFKDLFSDMRQGMNLDKVKSSPSELRSIVKSFMECLTYVLMQTNNLDIVEKQQFLLEQLFPVIQSSIQEEKSKLSTAGFNENLAQFLITLHLSATKDKNQDAKRLFESFWDHFCTFCLELLKTATGDDQAVVRLTEFFLVLHNPARKLKSLSTKVRFTDVKEIMNIDKPSTSSFVSNKGNISGLNQNTDHPTKDLLDDNDCFRKNPLLVCLQSVLILAMQRAVVGYSTVHMTFLSSLCLAYSDPVLFAYLMKEDDSAENPAESFFLEVTVPWFSSAEAISLPVDEFAQIAINMTIASYLSVDNMASKQMILNTISQTENPALIECLLQTYFYGREKDKVFQSWLKSDELSLALVSIAKKLSSSLMNEDNSIKSLEIDVIWSILTFILSDEGNFECTVSSSCLGQILDLFHFILPKSNKDIVVKARLEASLQFICDLASRIFVNFKGCWQIATTEELILNFVLLTCDPPKTISDNILQNVNNTVSCGIKALIISKGFDSTENGFFHRAFSSIKQYIVGGKNCSMPSTIEASLRLIEHFKICTSNINESSSSSDSLPDNILLSDFCNLVLPDEALWESLQSQLGNQWMLKAHLTEIVTIFESSLDFPTVSQLKFTPAYIQMASFVIQLLCKIKLSAIFLKEEKENFLSSYPVVNHLKEILFAFSYCEILKGEDALSADENSSKSNAEINWHGLSQEIKENFLLVMQGLPHESLQEFFELILTCSLSKGNMWAMCIHFLCTNILNNVPYSVNAFQEVCRSMVKNVVTMSEIQTIQALDKVCVSSEILDKAISNLISTDQNWNTLNKTYIVAAVTKSLNSVDISGSLGEKMLKIMDTFILWRDSKENLFLYSGGIHNVESSTINFNVEVQRFLISVTLHYSHLLSRSHWDFILCGLCSWIQTCFEHESFNWLNLANVCFTHSSCRLLRHVCDVIANLDSDEALNHPGLKTEWVEFFSDGLFSILFPSVIKVAEAKAKAHLYYAEQETLKSMLTTLETIPETFLETTNLLSQSSDGQKDEDNPHIPSHIQILMKKLVPLLNSSVRSVQLCAYKLIQKIIPVLSRHEENLERIDNKEYNSRQLPLTFHLLLTETTAVVNATIAEMQMENFGSIQLKSNNYNLILAYLLAWNSVLELFTLSSSELRSEYASYLQHSGLMHDFLANIFYFISENSALLEISHTASESPSKNAAGKTLFSEKPALQIAEDGSALELVNLSCQVYFQAVKKLPVLVRQWWNNLDKSIAVQVDKITSKYVTPLLCCEEFQLIQHSEKKFENMMV